jgi:hypothetical protein
MMARLPATQSTAADLERINIIFNWLEELKEELPTK